MTIALRSTKKLASIIAESVKRKNEAPIEDHDGFGPRGGPKPARDHVLQTTQINYPPQEPNFYTGCAP